MGIFNKNIKNALRFSMEDLNDYGRTLLIKNLQMHEKKAKSFELAMEFYSRTNRSSDRIDPVDVIALADKTHQYLTGNEPTLNDMFREINGKYRQETERSEARFAALQKELKELRAILTAEKNRTA